MRNLFVVVGCAAAILLIAGAEQRARGFVSESCEVTRCGTNDGIVAEACTDLLEEREVPEQLESGGGAALPPGECETIELPGPCEEIPECAVLFATRRAPAVGTAGLLLTALLLGVNGAGRVRRRRSRRR